MAVPLPVDIVMGALPLGFKGNLQEYANAIADAMSATVEATFLTGQIGGSMPTSDIGPWANGSEWWFWDPATGQYQPTDQGSPVGSIIMWGGAGVPANWLLCDGSAVSRSIYSRLFQAIGTVWGGGDGTSTFNLPPPGRIPIGAPQYTTFDDGDGHRTPYNIPAGTLGGSGAVTLQPPMMPHCNVWVYYNNVDVGGTGKTVSAMAPVAQPGTVNGQVYPVVDGNLPLGQNQSQIFTMPPFMAVNFIIKYQ